MRRRSEAGTPPAKLVVFEGRRYRTARTWQIAFDKCLADREAWAQEHEGALLPQLTVNGSCPFDYSRFQGRSR